MEYYNAIQAAKKLGIKKSVIAKMLRNKEIKTDGRDGRAYRISEEEITRLKKQFKQKENTLQKQLDEAITTPKEQFFTITQVADKFGIDRDKIENLLEKKLITFVKKGNRTSPRFISENELSKIQNLISDENLNSESLSKPVIQENIKKEETIQMKKDIIKTLQGICSTQDKIAISLISLLDKM